MISESCWPSPTTPGLPTLFVWFMDSNVTLFAAQNPRFANGARIPEQRASRWTTSIKADPDCSLGPRGDQHLSMLLGLHGGEEGVHCREQCALRGGDVGDLEHTDVNKSSTRLDLLCGHSTG